MVSREERVRLRSHARPDPCGDLTVQTPHVAPPEEASHWTHHSVADGVADKLSKNSQVHFSAQWERQNASRWPTLTPLPVAKPEDPNA